MTPSPAMTLLASLVLDDGRRWGDAAEPWQHDDARTILDGRIPWHFLTRARGASKTTDLAGVGIAALVEQLPPASRSYAVAADADQGGLLVDAMRGFVARTPGLATALRIDARRALSVATGASLEVLAADAPSAYGLLPHLVVVDELAAWPSTPNARGVWTAVVSALAKVPGARLVVLTTAGDPAHWSYKVLTQARRSRRWRVRERPGPTPWVDPDVLEEQRALLTDSQYRRLHLNQWTASEDRLVRPEDLAACVTLDGPRAPERGRRYVVGVDLGLRSDRTAIAVAHAEPVGGLPVFMGGPARKPGRRPLRVVLDRLVTFAGSRTHEVSLAEVETALVELWERYGHPRLVGDPWQAIDLYQRLRRRGVHVDEFTFSANSVGRLAVTLHTLLRDHRLALPDDRELADELLNVRLRENAVGQLRLDHDAGRHDDRAVALALAASALVEAGDRAGGYRSHAAAITSARIDARPAGGTRRAAAIASTHIDTRDGLTFAERLDRQARLDRFRR